MYKKYIERAVKSVFIDAFGAEIKQYNTDCNSNYKYISSIKIGTHQQMDTIYFSFQETTMKILLSEYMFEDDPDDELVIDFSGEMANLIVGKAKVFAQNDSLIVDITTPIIENSKPKFDSIIYYNYKNQCFQIGVNK